MNSLDTVSIKQSVVFDRLYDLITSGYFRLGENLSEREIANMLDVSRTPVREAFRRLEREGLVTYQPKKGVMIRSFTEEEIINLYRVREYMEKLTSRLLSEKQNITLIEKLKQNVRQAEIAAKDNDVKEQAIINAQFHLLMVEGTNNSYLINVYKPLTSQLSLFRSKSLSYKGRSLINIEEHNKICEAIERGDTDLAEEITGVHVQNSLKALLKSF
ncbi:GntR family transcriptional regulator [Alteribacter populi]|uniref:GntR family transcriptional regulator n=1 Tax=Alteribacter populi TaxID=2011011 RepID=UPI000BBB0F41|nr:GntR family transcriptional regulator [Alteribacter populi]